jgi:hypothetical protein
MDNEIGEQMQAGVSIRDYLAANYPEFDLDCLFEFKFSSFRIS